MKKTQKIILTVVALIGAAGCSSLEDANKYNVDYTDNRIGVKAVVDGKFLNTRATEMTTAEINANGKTFMVWGYLDKDAEEGTPGALYMGHTDTEGVVMQKTGSGWEYQSAEDVTYWPEGNTDLNFQAVMPYDYGTLHNNTEEKIPQLSMTVEIPEDNSSQHDLMFGHEEGVLKTTHDGTAALVFQHALSQIVFNAKKTVSHMDISISEISIHNVRNSAKVGYTGTLSGSIRDLSVTDYRQTVGSYTVGMTADRVDIPYNTVTSLTADDGVLMMLPQSGEDSPEPWNTTADTPVPLTEAESQKLSYIQVKCKVNSGTSYIIGSEDTDGTVYIPFKASWEPGYKYTYTLTFGKGEGSFDAEGKPSLTPVTFSIDDVEDWTETEKIKIEKSDLTINDENDIL